MQRTLPASPGTCVPCRLTRVPATTRPRPRDRLSPLWRASSTSTTCGDRMQHGLLARACTTHGQGDCATKVARLPAPRPLWPATRSAEHPPSPWVRARERLAVHRRRSGSSGGRAAARSSAVNADAAAAAVDCWRTNGDSLHSTGARATAAAEACRVRDPARAPPSQASRATRCTSGGPPAAGRSTGARRRSESRSVLQRARAEVHDHHGGSSEAGGGIAAPEHRSPAAWNRSMLQGSRSCSLRVQV